MSGMKKVRAVMLATAVFAGGVVGVGVGAGHVDALTRNRCREYEQTAREVGWSARETIVVSRVMWRESRCQPGVVNTRGRDHSLGLTQINTRGYLWGGVLAECGARVKTRGDLLVPRTNLWCAKQLRDRYGMWMMWRVRA